MRAILLSLCLLCPALANAQDDANEAVAIGPWQIEASYRGADFQRCVMRRTTEDGIDVSFSRDAGGLELRMASPRWRLKRGDSYPVDLIAGSTSIMTNVNASKNAVSLAIEDERFLKALRLADELDVKGAGIDHFGGSRQECRGARTPRHLLYEEHRIDRDKPVRCAEPQALRDQPAREAEVPAGSLGNRSASTAAILTPHKAAIAVTDLTVSGCWSAPPVAALATAESPSTFIPA